MKNLIFLFAFLSTTVGFSQTATEAEIKTLSNNRNKALMESDFATLEAIYDENSVAIHSNGIIKSATEHLSDVRRGFPVYRKIEVKTQTVYDYETTAVLVGTGDFQITMNGQQMDYKMVFTEVYQKKGSGWKLIARHASAM